MTDLIRIPWPDDFHAHFRRGPAAAAYIRRHAAWFGRALAMPNTVPPVASGVEVARYREELRAAAAGNGPTAGHDFAAGNSPVAESGPTAGQRFEPLMTFKILPGMSADTVASCAAAGAIAGKYYPAGATTNSSDGLRSPDDAEEALEAMESLDLVLCVHGEDPEAPVFEREKAFLPTLERIMTRRPRLRVVLEHLSSTEAVRFVLSGPRNLGATVTAHHLLFTLEDMLAEGMNPHLYCKPVLKTAADRETLRDAVFSGSPKLFFGSDSAPHPRAAKECAHAASGVYSAPSALSALAELFDSVGLPGKLGSFTGAYGARFYGLPEPAGTLTLERSPWTVPTECDGAVPMCAGAAMNWRIRA
ncbi:MAG: amidohydrolase family protein [Rectinemataceae bacterium]